MQWVYEDDYKIVIPKRNNPRPILCGGDLYDAMFNHYLFETYHHTDIFHSVIDKIMGEIKNAETGKKIFTGFCCYMDKSGHRNVPVCVAGTEYDYHPIYYKLTDDITDVAEIDMGIDISEHTHIVVMLNKSKCVDSCIDDYVLKSYIQHELLHGIQLIASDDRNILDNPKRQLSIFSKRIQYFVKDNEIFELDCSDIIDSDLENLMYLSCITEQNAICNELYHYIKDKLTVDLEWKDKLLKISDNYKELVNNILNDIDEHFFIRNSYLRLKDFISDSINKHDGKTLFEILFIANALKNANLLRLEDISEEDIMSYNAISTRSLVYMYSMIQHKVPLTSETIDMFRPIVKYIRKLINKRFDHFYNLCCGIIYNVVDDIGLKINKNYVI